jgi:hypothetical protein
MYKDSFICLTVYQPNEKTSINKILFAKMQNLLICLLERDAFLNDYQIVKRKKVT